MRFRFIEDHRASFPVRTMCAVLEVSASGYYAWRDRPESARARANRALAADIRRVHADSRAVYGSPRVHAALRAEGRRVGVHRVARLMRHHGIQGRHKRRRPRTTDSNHSLPVAPNLLDRRFAAPAPNRVWLADITYIPTAEGWLYLAVVLDMFSRRVVGWAELARRFRRPKAGGRASGGDARDHAAGTHDRCSANGHRQPPTSTWSGAPFRSRQPICGSRVSPVARPTRFALLDEPER